MAKNQKPELALGSDRSPEGLDEAALQMGVAAYRAKYGVDPPAEHLRLARERLAARRSTES